MKSKQIKINDKNHLAELLSLLLTDEKLVEDLLSDIDESRLNNDITYSEEYVKKTAKKKESKPKKLKVTKTKTVTLSKKKSKDKK